MGASESPPTVRPETNPPPPGPSDCRATGAALGMGLHLESMGMLTFPHRLPAEDRGASCFPPHPLHSGAGSQPSACPAYEELCPCHLPHSTPWHCAVHLLPASTSVQPGMQRFPRDWDRQPSTAHRNSHPDCSPSASCGVPFGRRQGPIMHLHRHPYPQGCSPQRLGLSGLGAAGDMTWRRDMARVGGWVGTPGKPVETGMAAAQLHLPSCWNCLRMSWGPCPLEDNAVAKLLPQP